MRVSPIAWFYDDLGKVLEEALHSAEMTHNHPEGIKGAQAVAAAVFMARNGTSKDAIKAYTEKQFRYDLSTSLDVIRQDYGFEVSCQKSVPQAIIAFLESTDFEDAVRNAVSLGGDSDTQACIAGSIAEAYYGGVPSSIVNKVFEYIDFRLSCVVKGFREKVSPVLSLSE
jgi:ADP-ribosylglycohydrolase